MGTEVKDSEIHGKGLFATRDFRTGEQIGIYEGRVVVDRALQHPHTLSLVDEEGRVFGIKGSNDMRYMNHDDEPNATIGEGGVFVFALRPIEAGEEITVCYAEDWAP